MVWQANWFQNWNCEIGILFLSDHT